ncbi:antitoxin VapB family protein [Halovenus halobia]|uniref:antitoxin VapB family protein n=1 Tax=Halovenus halobia TaxID=3396622 RepID=UPI003F57C338
MGTKTIGLREDAYEKLKARKREDESFTDLVERLLEESTADWRDGFGTLPEEDATELERFAATSRDRASEGTATRQQEALEELSSVTDGERDETA